MPSPVPSVTGISNLEKFGRAAALALFPIAISRMTKLICSTPCTNPGDEHQEVHQRQQRTKDATEQTRLSNYPTSGASD